MLIQVKGIKPAKMRVDNIRFEMMRELEKQGKETEREFEKTVESWKGDKPKFESLTNLTGSDAELLTGPTGNKKALDKFKWLDEGTGIRWAVMSKDWQSKTRRRFVGSGSGRGRVVIMGRRAMQKRHIAPRPGIEAREWTPTIQARRKPKFISAMLAATRRGAERLYG